MNLRTFIYQYSHILTEEFLKFFDSHNNLFDEADKLIITNLISNMYPLMYISEPDDIKSQGLEDVVNMVDNYILNSTEMVMEIYEQSTFRKFLTVIIYLNS